MRLDKFVSTACKVSRSEARKIIKSREIEVNGIQARSIDAWIEVDIDQVSRVGNPLVYKEFVYIMLHKPSGYVSANKDVLHPTVMDLLPQEYLQYDLSICGRLDIDTEGLILVTNDGALVHRITAPKKHVEKTYEVIVEGSFEENDKIDFKNGMVLHDDGGKKYRTKPAKLEILDSTHATITISEGKTHQIKKMCKHLGKQVIYLKRLHIGSLVLDKGLQLGESRLLTTEEIENLKMDVKQ